MGESRATRLGNYVTGPVRGRPTRVNTSGTQAAVDLTTYIGRPVAVTCFTVNTCVALAAGNNTTTYAITPTSISGPDMCAEIPSGNTMEFFVEKTYPWLHYINASSTGYLRIVPISLPEDPSP